MAKKPFWRKNNLHYRAAEGLIGAGIGAATGAFADKEDRVGGALTGAAIGGVGGLAASYGIRKARGYHAGRKALKHPGQFQANIDGQTYRGTDVFDKKKDLSHELASLHGRVGGGLDDKGNLVEGAMDAWTPKEKARAGEIAKHQEAIKANEAHVQSTASKAKQKQLGGRLFGVMKTKFS